MKLTAEQLLADHGVSVKELQQLLRAKNQPRVRLERPRKTRTYRFGLISDTHLVDKACALAELKDFYTRCAKLGIKEVLHCGDLASGLTVYKGQINDMVCFGFDNHLEYVVKHYPHVDGVKTIFVGGNHCENYALSGAGELDFCAHLARERKDIEYLGLYDGVVKLNGVTIELHHGAKGMPYSCSYHLQKYVEKIGAGTKPQIYALGHYHTSLYMFYRNIHCFLPGCFQRPTNLSVRLGLPNLIGGWILEMEVADDEHCSIQSLKQNFVAYY